MGIFRTNMPETRIQKLTFAGEILPRLRISQEPTPMSIGTGLAFRTPTRLLTLALLLNMILNLKLWRKIKAPSRLVKQATQMPCSSTTWTSFNSTPRQIPGYLPASQSLAVASQEQNTFRIFQASLKMLSQVLLTVNSLRRQKVELLRAQAWIQRLWGSRWA